jgi:hypothetical protein
MQMAIIAPYDMLELALLTDYHMVLPQECMNSDVYLDFYHEVQGYKILDNGEAEGQRYDGLTLLDIARAVGATEIVMPDKMGDYRQTMYMTQGFADKYHVDEFKYIGVVQGENMQEILTCLIQMDDRDYVDVIALPRYICKVTTKLQRIYLAEAAHKLPNRKPIHCLGSSQWIAEAPALHEQNIVRGMDTSLPINMGLAGQRLGTLAPPAPRPPNYFDIAVDRRTKKWSLIDDNVRNYLKWCGYTAEKTSTS